MLINGSDINMTKKNILIFTNSIDIHACAVEHVLQLQGANPIIVNTANIPNEESISIEYVANSAKLRIGQFEGYISDIHASWNRRVSKMFSLPTNLHPSDYTFVRNNLQSTLSGTFLLLEDCFPVNSIVASRLYSNKILQLQAARSTGFKVPKTLISNNYEDIQSFIAEVGDACVKPYYTHGWKTETGPVQALTVRLKKGEVFDRASFECVPHIYQEYIQKKSEYRTTIFGNYSATVKINSQSLNEQSGVDWRSSPDYLSTVEACELPTEIISSLKRILSLLNLRFGAFDGEYVFFEVNEAGQWLWQETHCPECLLLQPFSEFLLNANDRFNWNSSQRSNKFSAIEVLKHLENDTRFNNQLTKKNPDGEVHVSDERIVSKVK